MVWADEIRDARTRAGLSQRILAERAGTSQANISLYESGRKQPTVAVLERLLTACGRRLDSRPQHPSPAELRLSGSRFVEALALAEALPFRRERALGYPRLPTP